MNLARASTLACYQAFFFCDRKEKLFHHCKKIIRHIIPVGVNLIAGFLRKALDLESGLLMIMPPDFSLAKEKFQNIFFGKKACH